MFFGLPWVPSSRGRDMAKRGNVPAGFPEDVGVTAASLMVEADRGMDSGSLRSVP